MKLPALKEIIEERKEKAIACLSDSFARNRLPLEEYERLVEYINKIESERELVVVEKIVAEHSGTPGRTESSRFSDGNETPVYDEDDDENEPDYPHPSRSSSNVAILSSRTFSGPLKSGSELVSILGSGYIKVRKADLAKRQTVLNVVSILGDIVIAVESGIQVNNKVMPVLGNSSVNHKVTKQALQGDPELVISGVALLGSISVKLIKEVR
jgi:hypothetical protein